MSAAFHKRFMHPRFFVLFAVPAVIVLSGCPPNNPDRVKTNVADTTLPTPVSITGRMTGGGGDSTAGATVPGVFPALVVLNSTAGQLEITVVASDAESGIAKLEIHSNDRLCNFKNPGWGGGNLATIVRSSVVNTPDSNGTLPVKSVALANIQVTTERGTFDKRQWQIFGVATNSAGKFVNIGPLTYTAVSANVPAAHRMDSCP